MARSWDDHDGDRCYEDTMRNHTLVDDGGNDAVWLAMITISLVTVTMMMVT